MMTKGHWAAGLLFAASLLRAAEPQAPDAEFERYADAVVQAAQASRDARVLVAAASFAPPSPRRDAMLEAAMRFGADDPVVWWVIATDRHGEARAEAAVQRLRELAPNNAVGWLMPAGPQAGPDLARAARSNRFDQYEGDYVRAMHAAARAVPAPASEVAHLRAAGHAEPERLAHLAVALGKGLANAWPHLRVLTEHCGDALPLEAARRDECIAIARLMANRSGSSVAQRWGTRLLVARLPPGEERRAAAAQRRRLDWLIEKQAALAAESDYPRGALRWLDPAADEMTALRAVLQESGLPLEPPAGWRSQFETVPVPAAD